MRIGTEFHEITDHYSHLRLQIENIQSIDCCKALIVGRGTGATSSWSFESTLPTEIPAFGLENIKWIFLDYFGGLFTKETLDDNIWCDFNDLKSLRLFPSELFDLVIIDSSTWRYLYHSNLLISKEWTRILKKQGRFLFEFSVSSIKVVDSLEKYQYFSPKTGQFWHFEFSNFSHAVIKNSESIKTAELNQRVILPVNQSEKLEKYYKIADFVKPKLLFAYESYFYSLGFKRVELCQQNYPILTKHPVQEWILLSL